MGAEEDDAARATGAQTTPSGKASLPTANRCLRNGGRNDDYGRKADENITSRLKDALSLVDVRVLDHFVVGGDVVTSFAECGLL